MKKTFAKVVILAAATMIMLAAIGCTGGSIRVGELQTDTETVELGDASSVDVEIEMGAGELNLSGGADELLEADFTYNVAELEPDIDYRNAKLSVLTPDVRADGIGALWDIDDYRYEWELRLNDRVPMNMDVTIGAGRGNLMLGTLSLSRLDVKAGAGDVTLDLAGSSSLTALDVEAGVGEITVDLSGNWERDMDADIQAGIGNLTILLPHDTGVRVDVEGGIGGTNVRGLTRDGSRYLNDAYGESEVTLRINIDAGIGEIHLQVSD